MMKKVVCLFVIALFAALLCACGQEATQTEEVDASSKAESVDDATAKEGDSESSATDSVTRTDNQPDKKTEKRLLKESTYRNDGSISTIGTYEYDHGFKSCKRVIYNDTTDAPTYFLNTWEYDSNGRLIKTNSYDSTSDEANIGVRQRSYALYEYDSNGRLSRLINNQYQDFEDTFEISYTCEYEYSSSGDMIRRNEYSAGGTLGYYQLYEYDSDGNNICKYSMRKKSSSPSDENKFVCEYETYEYNDENHIIKTNAYKPIDPTNPLLFDADGNTSIDDPSSYFRLLNYTLYEYDNDGQVSKSTYYQFDGESETFELSSYTIFEYE